MKKNVTIKITGHQTQENETTPLNHTSTAQYFEKPNATYILYEEKMEGNDPPIKTRLKIQDTTLTITKKGPLSTNMIFEEGKDTSALYQTPYGTLPMQITTQTLTIQSTQTQRTIQLSYTLTIDSPPPTFCHLTIEIENKE